MKEEGEKVGLKLNIQKTKIMASGPITSWQINEETVADYFSRLQNHCSGDCSKEIKRCLLLGKLPFLRQHHSPLNSICILKEKREDGMADSSLVTA